MTMLPLDVDADAKAPGPGVDVDADSIAGSAGAGSAGAGLPGLDRGVHEPASDQSLSPGVEYDESESRRALGQCELDVSVLS